MLLHSIQLAVLASLALGLPILVWSGDLLASLRAMSVISGLALCWGAIQQFNLNLHVIDGKIARAKLVPWRPAPIIDQPPPPPLFPAEKQPETAPSSTPAAPRGFVFNAGGKSGYMALEPAAPDLVAFLDTCIRLSAASKKVFPSTRDLDIAGYNFARYHQHIALLEGAIEKRKNLPPVVVNGWTLGDLRKMAAGDDLPR